MIKPTTEAITELCKVMDLPVYYDRDADAELLQATLLQAHEKRAALDAAITSGEQTLAHLKELKAARRQP